MPNHGLPIKWTLFDPCDPRTLPTVPGVYVWYEPLRHIKMNDILYVGSSLNLRQRAHGHMADPRSPLHHFVEFNPRFIGKFKPWRKWGDWLMIEMRLTSFIMPVGNRRYTRLPSRPCDEDME